MWNPIIFRAVANVGAEYSVYLKYVDSSHCLDTGRVGGLSSLCKSITQLCIAINDNAVGTMNNLGKNDRGWQQGLLCKIAELCYVNAFEMALEQEKG